MAKSVVTPERFAKGMTFDEYVKYTGSAENLAREAFGSYFADGGSKPAPRKDNSAVFRERYARARLGEQQAAAVSGSPNLSNLSIFHLSSQIHPIKKSHYQTIVFLYTNAIIERYQLVVHVDAVVLADREQPGQSVLDEGSHVPAGTSQRLACGVLHPLVTRTVRWRATTSG